MMVAQQCVNKLNVTQLHTLKMVKMVNFTLYMCVCMYMYTYIYTHIYIYIYTCKYTYIYTVYTCMHIDICIYVHKRT